MSLKIKRNSREIEEIPLSSTADIAFLLIVFFLSASALLEMKGVKLPLPVKDAPPMEVLKKDLFKIKINSDGNYLIETQIVTVDELRNRIIQERNKNENMVILLYVHPDAPSKKIPEIITLLQKNNIIKFSIQMDKNK